MPVIVRAYEATAADVDAPGATVFEAAVIEEGEVAPEESVVPPGSVVLARVASSLALGTRDDQRHVTVHGSWVAVQPLENVLATSRC